MENELFTLKWNNHGSTFFDVIEGLQQNELFSDVTLACDGELFPAHKLVLSTCSDYFATIFQNTKCSSPVVILSEVKKVHLCSLLCYMYKGETEIRQKDLGALMKIAKSLRIKGLSVHEEEEEEVEEEEKSHKEETQQNKRNLSDDDNLNFEDLLKSPKREDQDDVKDKISHEEESSIEENGSNIEIKTEIKEEFNPLKPFLNNDNIIQPELGLGQFLFNLNTNLNEKLFLSQLAGPSGNTDLSALFPHFVNKLDTIPLDIKPKLDKLLNEKPKQTTAENSTDTDQGSIDDKQFICKVCGYKSLNNSHLKRHMRSHTGERPYSCEFCDYRATNKSLLTVHIRTHTGEKPYACKYCDYRAKDYSAMHKHSRRHYEKFPYQCKWCNYGTNNPNVLKFHITKKHLN